MPAFFQTALADGHIFTDALRDDLIVRTSDSNTSILLGLGSNVESKVRLTSNEVFFNCKFRVDELSFNRFDATISRQFQPEILFLGPSCNLVIDSNNNQIRINCSNNDFIETDPLYQLYVNSNIYAYNMYSEHSMITSNLTISGDLTILGEVNTIDTNIHVTERFALDFL